MEICDILPKMKVRTEKHKNSVVREVAFSVPFRRHHCSYKQLTEKNVQLPYAL